MGGRLDYWIGKKALSADEIDSNRFLKATRQYANTAIQYGRNRYSCKDMPLFADCIHIEHLKAPRSITSHRTGTEPGPTVWSFFHNQQNLMRLLASLSQFTGEGEYVNVAGEAAEYMFNNYWYEESGLLHWGGHGYVDLVTGNTYGMKGVVHEIEDVYPYWELLRSVNPERGEMLMKGIWEANVKDWNALHYNRHGDFKKQVDHANTWNRFWDGYKDPDISSDLSFISVGLDLAYAAYSLGYQKQEEAPRIWAERLLNLIIKQRDPETGIWPNLVHPQISKRGLNIFGRKYPQATEPRVYVGNQLNHTITQMMGMLAIVENAQKYSRLGEMAHIKEAVEKHIIGFLDASYDKESNKLKSIIIDGTDLTGFRIEGPFRLEKLYFGAKNGGAFLPQRITPLYTSVCARGYRVSNGRREFRDYLRDMLKAVGIGDIGIEKNSEPLLNFNTNALEPAYIFALVDLFRVEPKLEFLKMAERIGDNLIEARQHPDSGLFTLEDDFIIQNPVMDKPKLQEPHEGKSVIEILGDNHKIANLDSMEPLALLSIYAAQTGKYNIMPGWTAGGLYLKVSSVGHILGKEIQLWFDKPALKQFYKDNNIDCSWSIDEN
jgi:pectate disaccharide-lyase